MLWSGTDAREKKNIPSTTLVQPQHERRQRETDQAQRSRVRELLVRRERHLRDRVVSRPGSPPGPRVALLRVSRIFLDNVVVVHVVAAACACRLVTAWWVLRAEGGDGLHVGRLCVGHCSGVCASLEVRVGWCLGFFCNGERFVRMRSGEIAEGIYDLSGRRDRNRKRETAGEKREKVRVHDAGVPAFKYSSPPVATAVGAGDGHRHSYFSFPLRRAQHDSSEFAVAWLGGVQAHLTGA